MAFFYVKGGGTASATTDAGRAASARTGVWTATTGDYYDTLSDAINAGKPNPPTAGDFICWSDESTDSIPGDTTVPIPEGVTLITVDNDNVDQHVRAATAQISNAIGDAYRLQSEENIQDHVLIKGVNIDHGDPYQFGGNFTGMTVLDSQLDNSTGLDNQHLLNFNDGSVEFICTDFLLRTDRDQSLSSNYKGNTSFFGGSLRCGNTKAYRHQNDGTYTFIVGQDLSASAPGVSLVTMDNNIISRMGLTHFANSKLPSAYTIDSYNHLQRNGVIIESCDSRYQYLYYTRAGIVEFVTNIYHNDSVTLDDRTNKGSFEFETDGDTTNVNPLFLGPVQSRTQLSAINTEAATKKKVRLYMVTASGQTIDDSDVVAIVFYPNSAATYRYDCTYHWLTELEVHSALPEQTSKWTGPGLGTQYYIDIDMGDPGNGRVAVIPGITKSSVTVYMSWQLEFVA